MNFGAFRTDRDRLDYFIKNQATLDSKPTSPQHLNWKLRQVEKSRQIGPEFKFNSSLQVQRLMDSLTHDVGKCFQIQEIHGSKEKELNHKIALKDYVKTGKYFFE